MKLIIQQAFTSKVFNSFTPYGKMSLNMIGYGISVDSYLLDINCIMNFCNVKVYTYTASTKISEFVVQLVFESRTIRSYEYRLLHG